MLQSNLIAGIRSIQKQKGYFIINNLGLSLGLASVFFIFLWIYDEYSYDRFHENLDHIFRVEQDQFFDGKRYHTTTTSYPAGEGWKKEIPEISESVRFVQIKNLLCANETNKFNESGILATDSSIFKVFTFGLELGDPNTALRDPQSIVLSKEMAERYFGNSNPLNRVITINKQYPFKVTAVLKKIPHNSSIQFDGLVPFDFTRTISQYNSGWANNSIQTYIKTDQAADEAYLNDKLTDVVKRNLFGSLDNAGDFSTRFKAVPLKKVRLFTPARGIDSKGKIKDVKVMGFIAIAILLIASINYVNMSTARSSRRSREIGMRKVCGAQRIQILRQFFSESFVVTIACSLLALVLLFVFFDSFRLVSGKQIDAKSIVGLPFLCGTVLITLITGLLAGLYPAVFLSGFKPILVLHGDPAESKDKGILRKFMIIIQFTVSLVLIVVTSVVLLQIRYMQKQEQGFAMDNLLYIRIQEGQMNNLYPSIKENLLRIPEIEYVSADAHKPGNIISKSGLIDWDGKSGELTPLVSQTTVDFDYLEMMGIPIVQGRSFNKEFPSDIRTNSQGVFVINESLASLIGKEDIIGTNLSFIGMQGPIIGIMKNYHYLSMREKIEPLAISVVTPRYFSYIGIRLRQGTTQIALSKIENVWMEIMPDYPFEYEFLSNDYENMYQSESRMGQLLLFFSVVAIAIALIGLFGLASFMAEKKRKEIIIRKIMGAAVVDITKLMLIQFIKLIMISIAISIPLMVIITNGFLENFAFRMNVSWLLFFIPSLALLILSLSTVMFQVLKMSKLSPTSQLAKGV